MTQKIDGSWTPHRCSQPCRVRYSWSELVRLIRKIDYNPPSNGGGGSDQVLTRARAKGAIFYFIFNFFAENGLFREVVVEKIDFLHNFGDLVVQIINCIYNFWF